jgi:hypothetical protein
MAWSRWLPWKFIIRRLARSHGFLDPIALLSRLERFAQPSEVGEPIELLRAGVVLHARGLINSRVIQHNLDWVWPYWVERQFDPKDRAFIPRAFSITTINLTHRNWTAVGLPDLEDLPIVDPRGLVTPLYDGWSLDGWILAHDGRSLLPSRAPGSHQSSHLETGVEIETETRVGGLYLNARTRVEEEADGLHCLTRYRAEADGAAWFVLTVRPYNPEGVSFIHRIELSEDRRSWTVNGIELVKFGISADLHHVSDYRRGDVFIHLRESDDVETVDCEVGMATAAALFNVTPGEAREIVVRTPLPSPHASAATAVGGGWPKALEETCRFEIADPRIQFLYDAAIRSLVLHSPLDVYPGPYTYKRFWFRDAAFIIHAMLAAGLIDRSRRVLDRFPDRQTALGFFHSQDGEWDSNGEALWIMHRYTELSGKAPPDTWRNPIVKGARWIARKRLTREGDSPHAGLLPAGFSAEHLGPNDYYYWDDFWAVAGLRSAAKLMRLYGHERLAGEFEAEARSMSEAIDQSLRTVAERLGRPAIPASPYRRLDAGAIGSIVCGYPLQLVSPDDSRLADTVNFLLTNCFVDGAFFQDMIHSGLNAYLTLEVAQVLLRAGNPRSRDLIEAVAGLASSTGQWPEAIHPRTGGGCMGDGHHVWASAEWVLMIRNCMVLEGDPGVLILGSGIFEEWIGASEPLRFGPAPTPYGPLRLSIERKGEALHVAWQGHWFESPPRMEIRIPGWASCEVAGEIGEALVSREKAL